SRSRRSPSSCNLGDLRSAHSLPPGHARLGAVDCVGAALVAPLGLRRVQRRGTLARFGACLEDLAQTDAAALARDARPLTRATLLRLAISDTLDRREYETMRRVSRLLLAGL